MFIKCLMILSFIFPSSKTIKILDASPMAYIVAPGFGQVDATYIISSNKLELKGFRTIPSYDNLQFPIEVLLGKHDKLTLSYEGTKLTLTGYCIKTIEADLFERYKNNKLTEKDEVCLTRHQKICKTLADKETLKKPGIFVVKYFYDGKAVFVVITRNYRRTVREGPLMDYKIAKVLSYDDECIHISPFFDIEVKGIYRPKELGIRK